MIIHLSCQWSFHSPKRLLVICYEPMIWYVIYKIIYVSTVYNVQPSLLHLSRACYSQLALVSVPCLRPLHRSREEGGGVGRLTEDGRETVSFWFFGVQKWWRNAGKCGKSVLSCGKKMRKMLEHVKLAILSDASEFTRKNVMGKPKAGHPNFSRWQVSQKGPSPFHPMA